MIVVIGLPAYTDEAGGERCAGGLAVEIAVEASRRGAHVELAGKVGGDGTGDSVVLALAHLGIGHAALLRDPVRPTPLLLAAQPESAGRTAEAPAAEALADIDGASSNGGDGAGEPPPTRLLPADPEARPNLDAADISMALRYLSGPSVIVVAEPLAAPALAAAVEGATFAGARLIALVRRGTGEALNAAPDVAPDIAAIPDSATVLEMPLDDDGSFARLVGTYAAALDAGTEPAKAFREGANAAGWEPIAD